LPTRHLFGTLVYDTKATLKYHVSCIARGLSAGGAKATIDTVNPATGERIASYSLFSWDEAADVARSADQTQRNVWSLLGLSDRTSYIRSVAKSLRSKKGEYSRIMTEEMGKPIVQSEAEVEKCAWTAEVYAENAERWLEDDPAETDAEKSYVTFNPLGVVLAVMPWNFPFWQAFRAIIPAVLAGNAVILRHSNTCPGSALAIEESIKNAGLPDGVFRTIISDHGVVARLIESDWIHGVTLTGSVDAGRTIGELAGRNLKKLVLELGGNDPFIVLEDANVGQAAKVGAEARLINSGQSCIAAKRFIVVEHNAKEFTRRFVEEVQRKATGDPMDRKTDVGPLVNRQAAEKIDAQVKDAMAKGARALVRGGLVSGSGGAFYEPTVLSDVSKEMRVMREEVFGPAAPICVVESDAEAIRVANESELGLGASVWTDRLDIVKSLAPRIQAGSVFFNALVKSDPRMPFGGIKSSGIGRELSKYGLKEFVNIKSVNVYRSSSREDGVAVE
jgi:acyl-CoA reductase-like NAD-dependent aldehyde dehydrogenase